MIEQRSPQWLAQRAGKVTASRFADAIAMKEVTIQRESKKEGKTKITEWQPTEARNTYLREVVAEILSGEPKYEIDSASLRWGREVEDYAREAFELETGLLVVQSEFGTHPLYDFIGSSPDGLIGEDGGLEMKCPKDPQVHIKTWMEGMPDDHIEQVQGNMYVWNRDWWEFVSYDPRQKEPYRLFRQRIERNNDYIDQVLEPGLLSFWRDVQATIKKLEDKIA